MDDDSDKGQLAKTVQPARKRPDHVTPPKHWKDEPVPEPEPLNASDNKPENNGPTRYGDWESNGIAIDF
ncbi:MAG: DUF1674 domain-containing protein [Pseudomonadota bacterium]